MSAQLTNSDVVQLIKLWKVLFGSKLKSSDWDINTVKVWTIALNDLEITPDEFAKAQRKSLTLEWPPTVPADFVKLGRVDPLLNYPDMYDAYINAAHHRWDDEGILYKTAKMVGLSVMREQPESKTYPQWKKHYPEVCKLHAQGLIDKPAPAKNIEHKKEQSTPCDEATAQKYIANIRALLAENKK